MKHAKTQRSVLIVSFLYSIGLVPTYIVPRTYTHYQHQFVHGKKITIVGTGYVGLVTGACLAEFGNVVICSDIIYEKIEMLKAGKIPIYEPGLEEVVKKNIQAHRLSFTHDIPVAIRASDVIFIAVGTPMSETGAADLTYVKQVIDTIAHNLNTYKVIVTKSTVPIGTGKWIKSLFEHTYGVDSDMYDTVSNPEFLREGCAVNDFLYPDRLVIGTESKKAEKVMKDVYHHLMDKNIPCIFTNVVSAETIKYASNAFLATKLSFINEIANLCDATGADVSTIALAMGLDKRISPQFLHPGPGFGGSCFPKDTQALIYTAHQYGIEINTVKAALETNEKQKRKPVQKLLRLMKSDVDPKKMIGKTIALLGLAFKSNTDDVRYSPAITAIAHLRELGVLVKAYDPVATDNMRTIFPDITYCATIDEAVTDADALIIMTEWDEFKNMNLEHIASLMRKRIVVDARNILDVEALKQNNFKFDYIGKSYLSIPQKRRVNLLQEQELG